MKVKDTEGSSYKQIFKSSFLVGGSQVITILLGIAKNKVLALLLGPAGIGVLGVYISLSGILQSIANLGIANSGVRQVSESLGAEAEGKHTYVVKNIRRILLLTSTLGALFTIVFSKFIAQLSFGQDFETEYILGVGIIAGMVFFDNLASGERAILQGARRLKALAMSQIIGSVIGTISSIAIVYFLGKNGIAAFLVITSFFIYVVVRFYSAKIPLPKYNITNELAKKERGALISLGLTFLVTTLAGSLVAYLLRMIVIDEQGLEGVGIYQASWGLVSMGFNVVLIAMGTDFYPRLVTVANDPGKVNETVNQQVEITLLLALPILLGLYLFSPVILTIFYSPEFVSGTELTRWLAISCFFRVLCWPLGYIIIAKERKKMFLVTSLIWELIHIPLIIFSIRIWGLNGIGISYVIDYAIVLIGSTIISRYYFKFNWSTETYYSVLISLIFILALVGLNFLGLRDIYFYIIGSLLIVLSVVRLLYVAQKKLNLDLLSTLKRFK